MKKIFFPLLFSFILLGSISAQNFIHSISPFTSEERVTLGNSLKILAVMVEFQKDNSSNTFGDGSFGSIYSKDYGAEIIDPLPHNAAYFNAHLDFAVDYFNKASDGKLLVSYDLLPNVITVSKNMLEYSTPINSQDLSPLGNFAQEVWQLVDQNFSVDFSQYDMFLIFHAGVGRDVNLPGSLGLERDLPSVYLSNKALKNIFGDSFSGFPVNDGSFNITNTAILPETESRELSVIGGKTLLELSINGLLVANIASHLGLPDLFDTGTGKSAIGRFGLMDGQAIFAYGGLFPPMPSAWERIYLGWATPSLIQNPGNVQLRASKAIVKIPINDNEYFLLENRNRDVNNDGATLTIWQNGNISQKTFLKDEQGFYSFDISALQGVVTSVDEYDWALPGSGIVIWHIDEKVIRENLSTNSINNNKNRRGVDVEEADGIQDIGEEFTTIFGDVVIGEGDSVDLWYSTNPSELYSNTFDQNSKPNTNSNDGGRSLVRIFDFSEAGEFMTFSVDFASNNIEQYATFPLSSSDIDNFVAYNFNSSASLFTIDKNKLFENLISTGQIFDLGLSGNSSPAFYDDDANLFVALPSENKIHVLWRTAQKDSILEFNVGNAVSTNAVWNFIDLESKLQLIVGTETGDVEIYNFSSSEPISLILDNSNKLFSSPVEQLAVTDDYYLAASNNIVKNNFGDESTFTSPIKQIALTQKSNGKYISIILTKDGKLYLTDELLNADLIAENCSRFALGNIKNDSENHIVYLSDNKLFSVSLTGSVDDNFPYLNPFEAPFTGTPLTAELNDDEYDDIIFSDTLGNIFAVDGFTGKAISPFPISMGVNLIADISLFVNGDQSNEVNGIAFATENGTAWVWNMKGTTAGKFSWYSTNGNPQNTNYSNLPSSGSKINEYFPKSKIYNWPNPVYGGDTFIHYYVSEDSDIEINIFDLSGNLVQKLTAFAPGGFESETKWNTDGIESGVYFAHVKAVSSSGKTEMKIVKIAVIH